MFGKIDLLRGQNIPHAAFFRAMIVAGKEVSFKIDRRIIFLIHHAFDGTLVESLSFD